MPRGPHAEDAAARGRVVDLLVACHPEPTALVTTLTSLLALRAGRGSGVVWVAAAVLSGQLAVGWTNDYVDRDLDRAAHRRDKPLVRAAAANHGNPRLKPGTLRTAAIAALAACVPLSLASGIGFTVAHLTAIAFAMAYNAGLKSTLLSVVPYTVAFGLLPAAVALSLPSPRWPATWAPVAGALIGAGGHFTQALPDIPADRRLGVLGLPQAIGQRASGAAAALLLLAANATVALGPGRPGPIQLAGVALAAILAAGIVAAALADRPRLSFRLTLAAATVAVLAFLASGRSLVAPA
ncbi:MAG TPA: UbiA family prenyltransferase [Candidatus Dormibacteraeota bacterium]|nr:UbiA family prenyltransferase [Candidatus Dormibacteraeota bacterium]